MATKTDNFKPYNIVEFLTEDGQSLSQIVPTIRHNEDAYDFSSGIYVKIVGDGLIIRNDEHENMERKYEYTDEFVGQTGEILGLKRFRDKDGNFINTPMFTVLTKKNKNDGLPSFTTHEIRITKKVEESFTFKEILAILLFTAVFAAVLFAKEEYSRQYRQRKKKKKLM